jgi:hypothetical protein
VPYEAQSHACFLLQSCLGRARPRSSGAWLNVIVAQLSVTGEGTAAGVIGGRGEMSYFIVCPQQVGQLVAVKHSMSDGRTSIDLAHFVQIRVPLSMSVSRPLLIVDAPVLRGQTAFNYVTRLTARSGDTAIRRHARIHDGDLLSVGSICQFHSRISAIADSLSRCRPET